MALKIDGKFKSHGVHWKSGHFYKFRYTNYFEDPEPLVVLLYRITGIHKNSGHQWNLIQCINMNYINRAIRKNFVINWKMTLERNNGNVLLTWNEVKAKFPGIVKSDAIRRYQMKPRYMIKNIEYIPIDKIEETVISSWSKDFSKKLKLSLTRKYRSAQKKRKKRTKQDHVQNVLKYLFGRKK